jgi:hypothetical protein
MNILKNIIAILLILLAVCSFVEMFNPNNTESILVFLAGTMTTALLLSAFTLKSIKPNPKKQSKTL